jgi:DNA-directed RNA polymerase specialized sigma subunit
MKFFGGYKDYEIMEKLGVKQHQLNQIEKRALEKLSHNLSDEDFF